MLQFIKNTLSMLAHLMGFILMIGGGLIVIIFLVFIIMNPVTRDAGIIITIFLLVISFLIGWLVKVLK